MDNMSENERLAYLTYLIRSSDNECPPGKFAYRGMDENMKAYYHVMCGDNIDFLVAIEPNETGSSRTVNCGMMRLMGANCRTEFPNR